MLVVVGDHQQRLEPAQHAIGAPVLGQLDGGAAQVAVVLLELRLELLEQREPSAPEPAKPAITRPSYMRRTLRASPFITVLPSVTCPSPAITTPPSWRTARIVVLRNRSARQARGWARA